MVLTPPFPTGACLGPTIQIGEETVITVDAKAAGQGKVTCKVSTPDGAELDVDVVENHDGTFDIFYTAPEPGKYVITIRFGGEHVPNSPFHVMVGGALGGGTVSLGGCDERHWVRVWETMVWAAWNRETMVGATGQRAGTMMGTVGLEDRGGGCGAERWGHGVRKRWWI